MENRLKFKNWLIAMLYVLILIIVFIFASQIVSVAYAEIPNSTNVLSDLQKDPNFKLEDYPDKSDDYSIQIIQIAESTAKELLIYTYQPCQRSLRLTATSLNMSLSEKVTDTNIYKLEFMSEEGVFCKYKVKDLHVSDKDYRYYNISSIYRFWIKDIDKNSGNNNTINEVAYSIGRLYKASTIDGKVTYSYEKMETIEVVNPYVGFLEFRNGWQWFPTSCRNHFIAFDTDKPIDELMEADVFYIKQDIFIQYMGPVIERKEGDKISETITLTADAEGETPSKGLFAKKYEWKLIEKSDYFIKKNDLTSEAENEVKKTKWVLRFINTEYASDIYPVHYEDFTEISNVSILRLKFRTGVKIYDLGVVSNKITGDNIPDNNNTEETDPLGWLARMFNKLAELLGIPVWALILIIVVILLAILLPILGLIFPPVGQILKLVIKAVIKAVEWLFNALVWTISLPIKVIVWIVNKCKGGGTA